ncbi:hypothetical protein CAEBREN_28676 [Caenorhabditis brenneri]|uniref:Phlebovirus glycoprotein G2 fusion domain-containing protein n=1 Tax=Caenorhabditis brenneri TaxID=135651 RepID=G0P2L2_CAEBE|nr:hypothetical protein CAEBREN_28676 [Caenorhabditis brenneri]
MLTLATLFTLIAFASADVCDTTHPITHDETTCGENGICRIEKIEDIFFTPETKTACLQIVSKKNVISKLKLTVAHNYRKCQKGPILFTKNVTVHADSAKRCHGMSECIDRKCLDIGPNSKLVEFQEGNKYPGHTYCASSCGGLWCKCLLPTPACLFYRTYAVPTTDEKFQIYHCDSWSNSINFQAVLTVNNEELERVFIVQEGEEYKIDYKLVKGEHITIKVKLLSITQETGLSILGKKFIQNGDKIALASISNEIFPLECSETGECNYRETCNCQTAESEALCNCPVPDLYKILDDKHHNLPVITERYHLAAGQDNVPTIRSKHNKLHAQIVIDQSYHTSTIESKIDCSISQTTPYVGCYNCLKGASQNVTCKSSEPTHAKLSCDNNDFIDILTCDKNGIVNEIHRKFNGSTPTGVCTVVCGNKNNSYKIEGKLTYVAHTSLTNKTRSLQAMSKRPNPNLAEEINSEAKRQAIAWQVQKMTTVAARELNRIPKPLPTCKFCGLDHHARDCMNFSKAEKRSKAEELNMCIICLNAHNHHPAKCRTLRNQSELCTARVCGDNYTIHHQSLCDNEHQAPSQAPPQAPRPTPQKVRPSEKRNEEKTLEERLLEI